MCMQKRYVVTAMHGLLYLRFTQIEYAKGPQPKLPTIDYRHPTIPATLQMFMGGGKGLGLLPKK